tara:strand:- start:771 stop:1145 length:375 start_codon:yes stop_codon:yes gene_type:complete
MLILSSFYQQNYSVSKVFSAVIINQVDSRAIGSTVIEKETKSLSKQSPRYNVLLHNDPVNAMDYVVITLREIVPQLSDQDAIAIMLEAHNTGVGLVITCDLEPAEFYAERLNAKGLTSTIEKEN